MTFVNLNDVYFPLSGGTIDGNVEVNGSLTVNSDSDDSKSYNVIAEIEKLKNDSLTLHAELDNAISNIEKLYIGLNKNSVLPYEKDGWIVVPMGKYVQISKNITYTDVSITEPWGYGIYESKSSYGNLDFPFEFIEIPMMSLSVVGTDAYAVMGIQHPFGSYSMSKTNTGSWYYYRPNDNAKEVSITTSITVIGKIKDDEHNNPDDIKQELKDLKQELDDLYNEINKES